MSSHLFFSPFPAVFPCIVMSSASDFLLFTASSRLVFLCCSSKRSCSHSTPRLTTRPEQSQTSIFLRFPLHRYVSSLLPRHLCASFRVASWCFATSTTRAHAHAATPHPALLHLHTSQTQLTRSTALHFVASALLPLAHSRAPSFASLSPLQLHPEQQQ